MKYMTKPHDPSKPIAHQARSQELMKCAKHICREQVLRSIVEGWTLFEYQPPDELLRLTSFEIGDVFNETVNEKKMKGWRKQHQNQITMLSLRTAVDARTHDSRYNPDYAGADSDLDDAFLPDE